MLSLVGIPNVCVCARTHVHLFSAKVFYHFHGSDKITSMARLTWAVCSIWEPLHWSYWLPTRTGLVMEQKLLVLNSPCWLPIAVELSALIFEDSWTGDAVDEARKTGIQPGGAWCCTLHSGVPEGPHLFLVLMLPFSRTKGTVCIMENEQQCWAQEREQIGVLLLWFDPDQL